MLGAGLWGTVLADHLARRGSSVVLWEFFPELARRLEQSRKHPQIPRLRLARGLRVTSDLADAAQGAGILLVALPSAHVRATARRLGKLVDGRAARLLVVTASKGVEPRTLKTMAEVIEEELPGLGGRVYALSGPSFAREVARGVRTKVMIAGRSAAVGRKLRTVFCGGPLQAEVSTDRRGVELGGTLKNVLAIACGMLDGMRAGCNTKAALLTAGVAEMGRLIRARGGRTETVYGLSGLGDLILTGTSAESRNRTLGEKLGAGKRLKAAMGEIPTVMEGVESARSAYALARASRVQAPVVTAVWRVLHRGAPSRHILQALGFD
ncbi:MAG: NAD(P)-dependent glycerol-3-phosphate dehydrogenase [Elusimicrobia bacterium]|nr:NAD(P)-dependent glycerol-3-phosphate dehydrogenase [Elusimicrobiota bacterium]